VTRQAGGGGLRHASLAELDLWQLAANPDPDVHAVSSTLATIPELATATIRFANSAYVGTTYPVGTVLQAVVRVGCRTVASLAVAAAGRQMMASFGDEEAWGRALVVSRGAKVIGRLAGLPHEHCEHAFVAGLFVDFGSSILAGRDTAYRQWRSVQLRSGVDAEYLLDREMAMYETTHAIEAGRLLEEWNLPTIITAAVAGHHTPASHLDRVLQAAMSVVHDDSFERSCIAVPLEGALEELGIAEHAEFVRREAALFADSTTHAFA
jgi:HD-like signal output (HDOD) protein